jgi:hypothetical protein
MAFNMPHQRSLSAGYLPVSQSSNFSKDIIPPVNQTLQKNTDGKLEREQSRSETSPVSASTSERRTYYTDLLQRDFSKLQYSKEKYFEYCKTFQALGQELYAENERLRAEASIVANANQSSASIRRATDESENSQKKLLPVPTDEVALVFDLSDNGLTTMKGNEIRGHPSIQKLGVPTKLTYAESNYIQARLPDHHWWRQESFHLYFSKPVDGKTLKPQPRVIVARKKQQCTSDREVNFIRTINLGKLGRGVRWKRFRGHLTSIYVLAPEPRPRRSPEMIVSKSSH